MSDQLLDTRHESCDGCNTLGGDGIQEFHGGGEPELGDVGQELPANPEPYSFRGEELQENGAGAPEGHRRKLPTERRGLDVPEQTQQ